MMALMTKDRNYIHAKAVSPIEDGPFYSEYDEHNRLLFERKDGGYWSMRFYHEAKAASWNPSVLIVDRTPYDVIHKWWHL